MESLAETEQGKYFSKKTTSKKNPKIHIPRRDWVQRGRPQWFLVRLLTWAYACIKKAFEYIVSVDNDMKEPNIDIRRWERQYFWGRQMSITKCQQAMPSTRPHQKRSKSHTHGVRRYLRQFKRGFILRVVVSAQSNTKIEYSWRGSIFRWECKCRGERNLLLPSCLLFDPFHLPSFVSFWCASVRSEHFCCLQHS